MTRLLISIHSLPYNSFKIICFMKLTSNKNWLITETMFIFYQTNKIISVMKNCLSRLKFCLIYICLFELWMIGLSISFTEQFVWFHSSCTRVAYFLRFIPESFRCRADLSYMLSGACENWHTKNARHGLYNWWNTLSKNIWYQEKKRMHKMCKSGQVFRSNWNQEKQGRGKSCL